MKSVGRTVSVNQSDRRSTSTRRSFAIRGYTVATAGATDCTSSRACASVAPGRSRASIVTPPLPGSINHGTRRSWPWPIGTQTSYFSEGTRKSSSTTPTTCTADHPRPRIGPQCPPTCTMALNAWRWWRRHAATVRGRRVLPQGPGLRPRSPGVVRPGDGGLLAGARQGIRRAG
jgi:hypothetical protein